MQPDFDVLLRDLQPSCGFFSTDLMNVAQFEHRAIVAGQGCDGVMQYRAELRVLGCLLRRVRAPRMSGAISCDGTLLVKRNVAVAPVCAGERLVYGDSRQPGGKLCAARELVQELEGAQ